ncbi:FepA family TonB-dependent siderophore receptor, partial [uncultured Paracoccus sp.]|uniref:FepA family TonB-dependent siderophore receptor n=1 Tax=uncultured Paracoccus sp. TaxID=189685 RepID=UPI0025EE2D89
AAASGEEFPPAGVEGVINKDLGALLTWDAAAGHEIDLEAAFSRQGNVYVGERGTSEEAQQLAHDRVETSRVYRRTLGVTHRGDYDFGTSSSYLQWENTRNASICKGTAGSSEGRPQFCVDSNGDGTDDAYAFDTVTLDNITGKTEWALPLTLGGRDQTLTLGAEIRHERMSDPSTPVLDTGSDQASKTDQTNIGIYAEDNIQWNDRLTLTPALRLDWADTFGVNVSPSLNATYDFNDSWSMKVGVARAFKAPNLFQLNPNYAYTSMGNGCRQDIPDAETRPPFTSGSNQCYIYGNPDLDPETSINGEIGIAYEGADQVNGSLTFFHNDYKDRISAGDTLIGYDPIDGRRVFVWDNTPKAVIQGLEGNFSTPLGDRFAFNANATYMIKSEDKETGQPLSLVPKHTINASLDWYATEALTVTVSATNYGRITPRTVNTSTGSPYAPEDIVERAGYTLFNLGSSFKINDTARLSAGITNLFDKEIYRTGGGSDANTFNEPGRAFYLSLSATF